MARHIRRPNPEIPPGGNKVVAIDGRDIVVFPCQRREFFALLKTAPDEAHRSTRRRACAADVVRAGVYQRSRVGEYAALRWHGWEFDMRNRAQSYFDPARCKYRPILS